MLTWPEKILFVLAVLAVLFITFRLSRRIVSIISRGHGKPSFDLTRRRLVSAAVKVALLQPTLHQKCLSP